MRMVAVCKCKNVGIISILDGSGMAKDLVFRICSRVEIESVQL